MRRKHFNMLSVKLEINRIDIFLEIINWKSSKALEEQQCIRKKNINRLFLGKLGMLSSSSVGHLSALNLRDKNFTALIRAISRLNDFMHLFLSYQMQYSENLNIHYTSLFQYSPECRNLNSSSPGAQTRNSLMMGGDKKEFGPQLIASLLYKNSGENFSKRRRIFTFFITFSGVEMKDNDEIFSQPSNPIKFHQGEIPLDLIQRNKSLPK